MTRSQLLTGPVSVAFSGALQDGDSPPPHTFSLVSAAAAAAVPALQHRRLKFNSGDQGKQTKSSFNWAAAPPDVYVPTVFNVQLLKPHSNVIFFAPAVLTSNEALKMRGRRGKNSFFASCRSVEKLCSSLLCSALLWRPPPARRLCDLYLPLTATPPVDAFKSSGGGSGFKTGRRDPQRAVWI